MANLGLEKTWNNIGGILYRTEVGDKFILQGIKKKEARSQYHKQKQARRNNT